MVSRSASISSVLSLDVEGLEAFGLATIEDLLRHYPRRYYNRGEVMDLAALPVGEHVTVQVRVAAVDRRRTRQNKWFTVFTVTDGHRRLEATFFNDKFLFRRFAVGDMVVLSGKVEVWKGKRRFTQPEIALDDPDDFLEGALGVIYPASAKVASWKIRRAVRIALEHADPGEDPIPSKVRLARGLIGQMDALRLIHRPAHRDDVDKAVKRLRFEEAFVLQTILAQRRAAAAAEPTTPRPRVPGMILDDFDARLPFELTAGQRRVAGQLERDLSSTVPMHRLLQGEVGSGKTVVAVRAMLQVIDFGGQAALLAPTEVLAQQHARSISAMLGPLAEAGRLGGAARATRVALLTGSQTASERRTQLLDAASGEAGIVVGTHALLEATVQFADLGLVVVDEQHRFGVEQRDALRAKGRRPPHLLVMTATPIPRTVAMTVFGDLETSTLSELPAGRSPIETFVVDRRKQTHFDRVWRRIREEVDAGRRAYVVCPRIDADDKAGAEPDWEDGDELYDEIGAASTMHDDDDAPLPIEAGRAARPPLASVAETFDALTEGPLAGLRLGMMHGRLVPADKDATMQAFAAGELDVLISTTVIEVGVDVPEATVMVVLDADRFGISQLHQLRGRVGRGEHPGICLLVTSADQGSPARERVDGVAATTDGFELARLDLEQRREGNVLGTVQSGRRSALRLLRLKDEDIISAAREEAAAIIATDPRLTGHRALAEAVAELTTADYLAKA